MTEQFLLDHIPVRTSNSLSVPVCRLTIRIDPVCFVRTIRSFNSFGSIKYVLLEQLGIWSFNFFSDPLEHEQRIEIKSELSQSIYFSFYFFDSLYQMLFSIKHILIIVT